MLGCSEQLGVLAWKVFGVEFNYGVLTDSK